jgi:hypothetical protein
MKHLSIQEAMLAIHDLLQLRDFESYVIIFMNVCVVITVSMVC